ncbi:ATP-binding protein [Methylobacterium sp. WL30]|uniref:tetratricopeptide repeat protein n=1 Tax=unclassified Methylobacterium TaxID=2615210 RepID=UPI0011C7E14D|nr:MULTISPECIES: ATP-binding protein [unclassified Methylobacterium]TXN40810.1 ATP-binding protein [Methylobacterium sp. WL93]TXN50734.1 ATP-binding protein [Methylobacterium sp. WL119]TXN67839.1 ATP-binding protein [Methylobacterium sp. WL30]
MKKQNFFTPGNLSDLVPQGDAERQAVDSLRGYAYQVLASAVAWIDIGENSQIFLEVAEDYAVVAEQVLNGVQVKDTAASGSVTLNTATIRDAVASFVDLVKRNPSATVTFRYLTTSPLGTERALGDRIDGMAGLEYWRRAAAGADPAPLRILLESEAFPKSVREFVQFRDDARLRSELLQRIQWDCGQPGFADLRLELEERLVIVGRDRFSLPGADARRLADILAFRVLAKSVLKEPERRVLRKAELYELLEEAAEVSLPRTAFAAMLAQAASGMAGGSAGAGGPAAVVVAGDPSWMISSRTLAPPSRFIPRPAVLDAVSSALGRFGTVILTGASGLGKSHIARVAAETHADGFVTIDFRDVDAAEARHRLDIALGRIGGVAASVILFEDLNHFDDPQVSRSLSRVMHALRHRDRVALFTCYRSPSTRIAGIVGIDPASIVAAPYFTEDESRELVAAHGGDPELWGRLAHVAGGWGHPQLVHAFVVGLAGRSWPRHEWRDIVGRGLTSGDLDAERESARRSLIGALPEHARTLLYRLSFLIGRFGRAAALALAETPPPIPQAAEALDLLVGPWIEVVTADQYRLSPLASGTGRSMLSEDEQERLHASIAGRMLAGRSVNASDIDSILTHALVGKADSVLLRVSMSLITLPEDKLSLIAESTTIPGIIEPERSFGINRTSVAIMLRLAQFKLLNAGKDKPRAAAAAAAAMHAVRQIKDKDHQKLLEIMVLSTVLTTMSTADYFDDWLDWLQRWQLMMSAPGPLSEIRDGFDEAARASNAPTNVMIFRVGTAHITTVERLEKIINGLDALSPADRGDLLSPLDPSLGNYAVLINSPWSSRSAQPDFDAADAAARYAHIAEKTRKWGIPDLAAQPWIARAVMHDEFMADGDGALAILEEATSVLGESPPLARARAKIYFRRNDFPKALEILHAIADVVGHDSPVERAFALREAAISAGSCGDWPQAEQWFRDAQASADAAQLGDMTAMAIGLGADAAAAALRCGEPARALRWLAEALTALAPIDPEASLRTAYVHRVVRHAVLWAKAIIENADVQIEGQPISVPPGTCSNPDPVEAIRQLPLSEIDTAWYTLAEAEIAAGVDAGILEGLPGRLAGGPIPMLEIVLNNEKMKRAIRSSDVGSFTSNITAFVSANLYLYDNQHSLRESFSPLAPPRGHMPAGDLTRNLAEQMACDAILAFGLHALFTADARPLAALQGELRKQLGAMHPGHTLFGDNTFDDGVALSRAVRKLLDAFPSGSPPTPLDAWRFGFRCFEQLSLSNFGSMLFPPCSAWLRQRWSYMLRDQRFLLNQPRLTERPLQEVLARPNNNKAFVAALLLAGIAAVAVRLPEKYVDDLRRAASN